MRPEAQGSDEDSADTRIMTATANLDRRDAGLRKVSGAVISHQIPVTLTVVLRRTDRRPIGGRAD